MGRGEADFCYPSIICFLPLTSGGDSGGGDVGRGLAEVEDPGWAHKCIHFDNCHHGHQLKRFRGRELNPGLPRDRRKY